MFRQRFIFRTISSLFLAFILLLSNGCANITEGLETLQDTTDATDGKEIEIEVVEDGEDRENGEDEKEEINDRDEEAKTKWRDYWKDAELVAYNGPVQHIFFHPLIAYPELTFDGDAQEKGFNDYFTTIDEFNKVIEALYEKDYILIDINMLVEEIDEEGVKTVKRSQLMLPEGKKPLIISIDDMNYYDYMRENGTIYKLILDDKGELATYSINPNGEEEIAYDNEIVPLLDKFVEEHPDFSFEGAKGVIALTGYEGILGYRTNELDSPKLEEEKKDAMAVVEKLKEMGWTFASHGYGHLDASKTSLSKLVADTNRWKAEVESLIGPTRVYIYPYGSRVLPGDPKFDSLVDAGFTILSAVGSQAYEKMAPNALMQDRRHIDGIGLIQQRERFLDLFDSHELIDYEIRPKKYWEDIKG